MNLAWRAARRGPRAKGKGGLALNARRTALCEGANLVHGSHGGIAGEGGEESAVGPAELHGFLGRFAGEQSVDEAGGVAIAAANAVVDIELGGGGGVGFSVDP